MEVWILGYYREKILWVTEKNGFIFLEDFHCNIAAYYDYNTFEYS